MDDFDLRKLDSDAPTRSCLLRLAIVGLVLAVVGGIAFFRYVLPMIECPGRGSGVISSSGNENGQIN